MKKGNAGTVSSESRTSCVSKSGRSTISNAQYCKNASNVSSGQRIVKDDFQLVLHGLNTLMFIKIKKNPTRWMLLVTNHIPYL